MNCEEVQESLWELLEGNIPEKRQEIQKHLDSCVACAREYQRLEHDMIQIKARRDTLAPDDEAWSQFLPGIRRKISLREARRQSVILPMKRLIPLFVMMAIIALLFHMNLPRISEERQADSTGFSEALAPLMHQDYIDTMATLGISDSDLYKNLVGSESANDLQRLDDWNSDGLDVIDQLMGLSSEEQDQVFSQLEKGLL
jgi:hypothetical protein